MNIGIIGAGQIGSALAGQLTSLGHSVCIANSRGPETLADVARKTGATPVTAQQAARHGDMVVVTIPFKRVLDLPKDLFLGVPAKVVVIDTNNYYPLLRDGQIAELASGTLTHSEWVQQQLGRPVVKVFNNIAAAHLENSGQPAGTPGRIALPVAGDEDAAKQQVMALVEELGFDAVDAGRLQDSWQQQPGTPSYVPNMTAAELRQHLPTLHSEDLQAVRAQFAASAVEQEKAMLAQLAAKK